MALGVYVSVHVCVNEGTPGEGRMGKKLIQCVDRFRSGERLMYAQAMAGLVSSLPRDFPRALSHGSAAIRANVDFC